MNMTLSEFMDHLSMVESPDSPVRFDMAHTAELRHMTKHPCGSACCIGGHASLLLGKHSDAPVTALRELLSIPYMDAYDICYPISLGGYTASLKTAMLLLEHYAATGEVDWDRALSREKMERYGKLEDSTNGLA